MQSAYPRTYLFKPSLSDQASHARAQYIKSMGYRCALRSSIIYISAYSFFHLPPQIDQRVERKKIQPHTYPSVFIPRSSTHTPFRSPPVPVSPRLAGGVSSSHRIQLASTHHTLPTLSTQRRLDQQRRIIHKKSSKLVYISVCAVIGNHSDREQQTNAVNKKLQNDAYRKTRLRTTTSQARLLTWVFSP